MKHRAIAAVAVLALATLSSTGVRAHPLDPILLEIIEHDDVVQLALPTLRSHAVENLCPKTKSY